MLEESYSQTKKSGYLTMRGGAGGSSCVLVYEAFQVILWKKPLLMLSVPAAVQPLRGFDSTNLSMLATENSKE